MPEIRQTIDLRHAKAQTLHLSEHREGVGESSIVPPPRSRHTNIEREGLIAAAVIAVGLIFTLCSGLSGHTHTDTQTPEGTR